MPYAKVKNFSDMERFHGALDGKIGRFDSRLHRFNYDYKSLIINSLIQI